MQDSYTSGTAITTIPHHISREVNVSQNGSHCTFFGEYKGRHDDDTPLRVLATNTCHQGTNVYITINYDTMLIIAYTHQQLLQKSVSLLLSHRIVTNLHTKLP